MYNRILVPIDGTKWSDWAIDASLSMTEVCDKPTLIGAHVYGANMHRTRFEQMEPGLPEKYQNEQEITRLRGAHKDLIGDGMHIISDAYISPLSKLAAQRNIPFEGATPEGRNYVEILKLEHAAKADLVIIGAHGHGHIPEAVLGTSAERILSHSLRLDVMLLKTSWNPKKPILVGVDGSQNSYQALLRAVGIAKKTGAPVKAVAVYDPYLHSGVFTSIAGVLPPEKQEHFNFTAQEQLHDEIIDEGLENLYEENLKQGVSLVQDDKEDVKYEVLSGKVFSQLHHQAAILGAGLVVVGRWGLHKEPPSLIGSNTINLARICTTNLLVVAEPEEPIDVPSRKAEAPLEWTQGALAMLNRIPDFARRMARMSVERSAREKGLRVVDEEYMRSVSKRMGMG